jgi:DNA-binding MarR family transcriptional regulator
LVTSFVSEETAQLASELISASAALRRATRLAGRPVEFAELTGAQLDLLRLVRRRPAVSVAEAAAELRLAPNTVSTLVRELTDARLIVRDADPADRRVARLRLAPNMQRKVDGFRDRRVMLLTQAIEELSAADQSVLEGATAILNKLALRVAVLIEADA